MQDFGRLSDRDHFCVSRGIIQCLALIATFGDDSLLINDDCSDRHFTFIKSDDGLVERFLHPVVVWRERILRKQFRQVSGAFRKIAR